MKKLLTIALGLIFLLPIFGYGQGPGVQWAKKFGGLGDDWAHSVIRTSDGGFLIVGYTQIIYPDSADSGDVYIVKTDSDGTKMWMKHYGSTSLDKGYAVKETSDTCYIVAGVSDGTIYVLKLDALGNKVFAKSYDKDGFCEGRDLCVTADHGYVVAGSKDSTVILIKADSLGNLVWTRQYGVTAASKGYSLDNTSDGGYIVAGLTTVNGAPDVYLIKTDGEGIETWSATYGGLKVDKGYSVQQLSDGGYVIAGLANSFSADSLNDVYLIRTDPDGNEIWGWTYGNEGVDNKGYAVDLTVDGGYIIAGSTYSTNGTNDYDLYLVKTTSSGETLWTMTYGGPFDEYAYSIQSTVDGGYIIAGAIFTDSSQFDMYLVKIESELGINENGTIVPSFSFDLNSNPARGKVIFNLSLVQEATISLRIYDITGRLIATPISERKQPGFYTIPWNAEVNAGVYFYSISSQGQFKTGKLVLVR